MTLCARLGIGKRLRSGLAAFMKKSGANMSKRVLVKAGLDGTVASDVTQEVEGKRMDPKPLKHPLTCFTWWLNGSSRVARGVLMIFQQCPQFGLTFIAGVPYRMHLKPFEPAGQLFW